MKNNRFAELQSEAYALCTQHVDGDRTVVVTDQWFQQFGKLLIKEVVGELEISKQCDPYTGDLFDSEWNACLTRQIEMIQDHFDDVDCE